MLGKALVDYHRLDTRLLLDIHQVSKTAGGERIMMSHGGPFHLFDPRHYSKLKFSRRMFSDKKVIFMIRDIRDVLVSFYFQETRRTGIYKGTIHDFIRDDALGAKKIVSFLNLWYSHRAQLRAFLLIRYEHLHEDALSQLRMIIRKSGVTDIPDGILKNAVAFSSFENMKKIEKKKVFRDSILSSPNQNDKESAKVRRGKVGGYVDYLDEKDCAYIDSVVQKMKIDGCDWYYFHDRQSSR